MEFKNVPEKPVQMRTQNGRGASRPKSFLQSILSRKLSKSQDETPQNMEAKQKRRLGSDRGASSGLMWNDNVDAVSQAPTDTNTKLPPSSRRAMSFDTSADSLVSPAAVIRNHTVHGRPNGSVASLLSSAGGGQRSAPSRRRPAPPPPGRPPVTSPGSGSSSPVLKGSMHSGRSNIDSGDSDPSSSGSNRLVMVGKGNKVWKVSFSDEMSEGVGLGERTPSGVYQLEYVDEEAFCIDGWNDEDDEGLVDELSDEEDEPGSEDEDEVDGLSSMLSANDGGGDCPRLRSADEGKAIPKFQRVAMEIVTTEVTYAKRLTMLLNLRTKLAESGLLTDKVIDSIFVNLPVLHQFHTEQILPSLQQRIDKWEKTSRIGDVMKRFAPMLKIYTPFIKNIDNARKVLLNLKKAAKTGVLITDFEKSNDSGRIQMVDFLTEPMTRLLRYKLLLGEYLRRLPEGHVDRQHTEDALDTLSETATHVNESIKAEDNMAKILQIRESLQGDIELVQQHRTFLTEGRIAMVNHAKSRHFESHIYLFNDIVLVCQPPLIGVKYKISKQLSIKGLKVTRDDDNHFTLTSRNAVIEFYGSTLRETNQWIKSFKDAIEKFKENHAPSKNEAEIELGLEEELGYQAPRLARRETASQCNQCGLGFKSLRRPKNHCHACGLLFCPRCSNRSLPLAYDNWQSRRVCDRCFSSLRHDAVCQSWEDLTREDWIYGDLISRKSISIS